MPNKINSFKSGLEAAALHLEGTAADYKQMAEQLSKVQQRTQRDQSNIQSYNDSYSLLLGQANHVRKLKTA